MEAGPQLYRQVKAAFVLIGESLAGWCRLNGYHHQNVRLAISGGWDGPRAREVRKEVISYLRRKGVTI